MFYLILLSLFSYTYQNLFGTDLHHYYLNDDNAKYITSEDDTLNYLIYENETSIIINKLENNTILSRLRFNVSKNFNVRYVQYKKILYRYYIIKGEFYNTLNTRLVIYRNENIVYTFENEISKIDKATDYSYIHYNGKSLISYIKDNIVFVYDIIKQEIIFSRPLYTHTIIPILGIDLIFYLTEHNNLIYFNYTSDLYYKLPLDHYLTKNLYAKKFRLFYVNNEPMLVIKDYDYSESCTIINFHKLIPVKITNIIDNFNAITNIFMINNTVLFYSKNNEISSIYSYKTRIYNVSINNYYRATLNHTIKKFINGVSMYYQNLFFDIDSICHKLNLGIDVKQKTEKVDEHFDYRYYLIGMIILYIATNLTWIMYFIKKKYDYKPIDIELEDF